MNDTELKMEKIVQFFENYGDKIFKFTELSKLISENREYWSMPKNLKLKELISLLTEKSELSEITLDFPHRKESRYVWGNLGIYEMANSIKPEAYFSHYSAVFLNNLTEQIPKVIYLNNEQKPKPGIGGSSLSQENIDLAFSRSQRSTNNIARYENYTIYLLNGKNTGNLGVISIDNENDQKLRVTNIERTLIDIVVRPVYSGGLSEILKAYQNAKEEVSVNKLASYLRKLEYVYPYHQSIGFLMDKTGYTKKQLEILQDFDIKYNFYLDYKIQNTKYDPKWRIFYPEAL